MSDTSHEARIRLKAYEIWLNEGQPHGRDQRHWEMAREAVGYEDAHRSTLEPVFEEKPALNDGTPPAKPAPAAMPKAAPKEASKEASKGKKMAV